MKDTVLSEKDAASYTKWLKFAKVRLMGRTCTYWMLRSGTTTYRDLTVLAEAPNEGTIVVEKNVISEKGKEGEDGSD
ncbi:hypothetical protein N7522_009220 [Penicillium canescens]|uniref:Uncharacterized protein n=1 Tax=Penicillium canescens TaxID=5083 RepID=A0AAD6IDV0_PENCN|nr:uncharacterized protein N7446_001819 [Penicillium canescens]KAJ5997560.1 hypothetical protein N7522_009220 [Penicillium canescens]KAJ6043622.1 hypothetical protein N7460_004977 [Penicillium canescens]KAJ6074042.1 hypothetical protein N7446_001819 [Penicillium canescens]